MAGKRRTEREDRERRVIDLAERVMVAIGERDATVAETEIRAGDALPDLTEVDGMLLSAAVDWRGETVTAREATRLRRLPSEPPRPPDEEDPRGDRGVSRRGDSASLETAGTGEAAADPRPTVHGAR